jgi:hypothetical protein
MVVQNVIGGVLHVIDVLKDLLIQETVHPYVTSAGHVIVFGRQWVLNCNNNMPAVKSVDRYW